MIINVGISAALILTTANISQCMQDCLLEALTGYECVLVPVSKLRVLGVEVNHRIQTVRVRQRQVCLL